MRKPTVAIIKSGSWKNLSLQRNHPEYSAISNSLQLYMSKIQFVLIGTSKTSTSEVLLKNGTIAFDIKLNGMLSNITYHLNLMKLLFKYKPNCIVVFGMLNTLPAAVYSLVSRKSKYVPIFTGDFGYYGESKIRQAILALSFKLLGILLRLSYQKIAQAFTLSVYTRNNIEKFVPKLKGIIGLVSYPISSSFSLTQRNFILKQSKPPIVLTVAGIEPRKGLDTLIKAIAIIPRKVKVVIKGSIRDSSYMSKLRSMVKDLNIDGRVTFITNLVDYDTLAFYYKSASLFVFPTREDCLGVVVLEALHSGLPVIATSVGGVPDMIENGVNGILVKPDDPHELANAISNLLSDAVLRKKLSRNARSVLNNRYYNGRSTLKEALIKSIYRCINEETC